MFFKDDTHSARRRRFFQAGLTGIASTLVWPGLASAANWNDEETANVKVVNQMCAAWKAPLDFEAIGRFLAADCVFRASETAPPLKGRQAIADGLRKMLGSPSAAEFEVVQTFARGPLVVNERFDRFTMPSRQVNWNGVGVFIVRNGLIAEWSDYAITRS